MKIKNVIFDLDGTLLNTGSGITESVEYAVKTLGLRELSRSELLAFIGPPLTKSFADICGCSKEEAARATTVFREFYSRGAVFHAEHYEGMPKLCESLCASGIKLGIATNKPQRFAVPLAEKFGLDKYLTAVCGANDEGTPTKTELIKLCMEKLGGSPADTVMVGDTINDAVGAEGAGVGFIAVTYGYGFRRPEDTADCPCAGMADVPAQIYDIIRNIR